MKLFGRSSGYYLFWTGFVYFWVGMYLALTHTGRSEIATLGFILVLSLPLWCPPVARYFNMEPLMFDWFKKPDYSNVVKFPEPKAVPDNPYVEPLKEEAPGITYYRLGLTNNGRVSFSMGYTEITLSVEGVNNLIEQLEVFRDQVSKEESEV